MVYVNLDMESADDEGFERGDVVEGRVKFAGGVEATDGMFDESELEGDAIEFGIHEPINKLNMITNVAMVHDLDPLIFIILP
jgi:hypothetical protein